MFFSGFSDGAEVNNAGNWWEKFFGEANFISSFSFLHLEKTISELSCVYTLRLLGALRRLSALNSTSSTLLFFVVALLPADLLMYDVCQGGFLSLGSTA